MPIIPSSRTRRALLLTLLIGALPATASAAPGGGAPVPALDWHDCDAGFECATAKVPRDSTRPLGPTIDLALIRFRAADQEHRIGTLFMNPGGPGGSGVGFVQTAPPFALSLLSNRFDVVGFDPRGVALSSPGVVCNPRPPMHTPLMRPGAVDVPLLLRDAQAEVDACVHGQGADLLPHLTTANAARDLDLLRAAVGDRKLTYYGLSYGGVLGETYAALFPKHVRAMVFDSPVDADTYMNRPLERVLAQIGGFEDGLQRFLTTCAAQQDVCRFGGAEPEAAYDALRAHPAPPLSQDILVGATESLLVNKETWPLLAMGLSRAEAGDGSLLRDLGVALDNTCSGVCDAYRLGETRYAHDLDEYLAFGTTAFTLFPRFAPGSFEQVAGSLWPFRPRGTFNGPFTYTAKKPIMVLASSHDPVAPIAGARRLVQQVGNARLLTVNGDGHGIRVRFNPCALPLFVRYIEEGKLPPEGATCPQDVPFELPSAGLRSAAPAALWGAGVG